MKTFILSAMLCLATFSAFGQNNGVHKTRYYVHCNWGWEGGACNGYYLSGVFDLSDGAVTSDAGTGNTSADFDFDWWFRTVTYDNPNK